MYIKIKDGKPDGHPVLASNIIMVFPNFDFDNIPNDWAKFIRDPKPDISIYEVYDGSEYIWDNNLIKEIHKTRPMTLEEKSNKQEEIKQNYKSIGFTTWIFNEETCDCEPPVPKPEDDKEYVWDDKAVAWVEKITIGVTRV